MSLVLPNKLLTVVSKADIQGQLDAIDTYINTTKVTAQALEPTAIEYRHLKTPVKYNLMIDKDPLTITNTSYGGWYKTDAILKHTASSNPDTSPMVLVSAMVGCTNAQAAGKPTACAIGVSSDAGATWTVILATRRVLGNGCGNASNYYDATYQPHYLSEAANALPPNIPSDHPVELIGTFGGEKSMGNPTTINQYCVMFDAYSATSSFYSWATMTLDARSAT